uniref:Uncharacterized protein n=1 Tax=Cannabis sativa TaxID=3483 RepID=A0A803NJD3_CANSA
MDDSSVDPIGIIPDSLEALQRLNRSSPEVEEKLFARMEIGDLRISPPLKRAMRSSCVYIEEGDVGVVLVDRKVVLRDIVFSVDAGTPWEWFHMLLTERRLIFDQGRGAKLIDDGPKGAFIGGRERHGRNIRINCNCPTRTPSPSNRDPKPLKSRTLSPIVTFFQSKNPATVTV